MGPLWEKCWAKQALSELVWQLCLSILSEVLRETEDDLEILKPQMTGSERLLVYLQAHNLEEKMSCIFQNCSLIAGAISGYDAKPNCATTVFKIPN